MDDMSSTIIIKEFEEELVDSNSSLDASKIICVDDNQINESENTLKQFSSDHINVNGGVNEITKTVVNMDPPMTQLDNVTLQPVFKVMFRDESVSRYEPLYIIYFCA